MKKWIMTLPPVMAAISCGQEARQAEPAGQDGPQRPNVVIIVADDLGFGDVSCYGRQTMPTPCLDSMARGGLLFNHAYATSATSSPSRYALFTGMYPWRADMHILPGDAPLMIPVDMPTMPKMFQALGYRTAAIGKWHLGMGDGHTDWNQEIVPAANTVGFDYTNIIPATVDRVPTVYVENGRVVGLDPEDPIRVRYTKPFPGEITGREHPELMKMPFHHGHDGTIINGIPRIGHMMGGTAALWDDATMADYFYERAEAFVDAHQDEPFFLYYGLHQPHVPRTASAAYAGSTPYGPRGDVIAEADGLVGRMMRHLEALNLLDNTLVIFTSDNGAVVQDGYEDGADTLLGEHDPNGGLRGGKYSLFDGGTHVPFIAYWKGHIQPGVSDAWFTQLDLYASLAALVGGDVPAGLDTENQLPVLLGQSRNGRRSQVIEAMGRLGYMQDGYALLPPYKGPERNETGIELGNLKEFALYNLAEDVHQDHDLAQEEPRRLRRLRKAFLKATAGFYQPAVEEEKLQ